MKTATDTSLLVIGYGNPLREDDGAGPLVAERIGARQLPGVRALACHQLLPEMAEDIAAALAVVFVDAAATGQEDVRLQRLEPNPASGPMTHVPGPAALLALAREVSGEAPPAWLLTIPAAHFGYATEPTPATLAAVGRAVREIELLAREWTF